MPRLITFQPLWIWFTVFTTVNHRLAGLGKMVKLHLLFVDREVCIYVWSIYVQTCTNGCILALLTKRLDELISWWPWCHTITLLTWGIYGIPTQRILLRRVKMMRVIVESKHSNLITTCAHWAQRLPKLDKCRLMNFLFWLVNLNWWTSGSNWWTICSWLIKWVNLLLLLLVPQDFLIYIWEPNIYLQICPY